MSAWRVSACGILVKKSGAKTRRAYPIEEDGCLAEDVPRFNELSATDRKGLIALVHLEHAGLMLRKLDIEFIPYLLHAWANDSKGSRVEKRSDREIVLLDLGSEEADAASHFVNSAYFTDEGTLEVVHFGVELNTYQHRSRRRRRDTHVFKLDIAEFTKFGNCVVCYFCRDIQLHKAHLLRTYVPPLSARNSQENNILDIRNRLGKPSAMVKDDTGLAKEIPTPAPDVFSSKCGLGLFHSKL